jgi:hypothetical protein
MDDGRTAAANSMAVLSEALLRGCVVAGPALCLPARLGAPREG